MLLKCGQKRAHSLGKKEKIGQFAAETCWRQGKLAVRSPRLQVCVSVALFSGYVRVEDKMRLKALLAATAAALTIPIAANASTVSATGISVNIYQSLGTGAGTSADAIVGNLSDGNFIGTAIFTGNLNFGTFTQDADTATIDQWLNTGGTYTEVGDWNEDLLISSPNINNNSALTTWFEFIGVGDSFSFEVEHDDGICFYENGAEEICSQSPTNVVTTGGGDYNGGIFQLVYAATNGDPSVLRVKGDGELSAVPLPAAGWMLLAGLGGLFGLRRFRKAT